MTQPEYALVGYFRFVADSDRPGVIGEVVGKYADGWAEDSSVPVYRIPGETKATAGDPEATEVPGVYDPEGEE